MTDVARTVAITPAVRQRMLDRLAATGGTHLSPIIKTLAEGVALLILPASKLRFDLPKRRNWVALIGDDLATARGPQIFHLKSLRLTLGRAHAVYLMIGAPVASAYQAAADVAAAGLNVCLIETQPAEQEAWADFVQRHARPKATISLATPTARRNAA